jgi:hypothetical protein
MSSDSSRGLVNFFIRGKVSYITWRDLESCNFDFYGKSKEGN